MDSIEVTGSVKEGAHHPLDQRWAHWALGGLAYCVTKWIWPTSQGDRVLWARCQCFRVS
jgi:hypothetical protein